jgi:hypothetical protein
VPTPLPTTWLLPRFTTPAAVYTERPCVEYVLCHPAGKPHGKLPYQGMRWGYTYPVSSTLTHKVFGPTTGEYHHLCCHVGDHQYAPSAESGTFYCRRISLSARNDHPGRSGISPIRPCGWPLNWYPSPTEDEQIERYIAANKLTVTEKTTTAADY